MLVRIGIRQLVVLLSATCLLLASGHTVAQAPPAGPDYGKRLRTLEDKMDRVLKLLEGRDARPTGSEQSSNAALSETRDKLRADLDAAQQRYSDVRRRNPWTMFAAQNASSNVVAERLKKIELRRADVDIKRCELKERLSDVEKAYDGGKNRMAALRLVVGPKVAEVTTTDAERARENMILQLTAERRKLVANLGENHAAVRDVDTAIDLVKKTYAAVAESEVTAHLAAIRAEIKKCSEQMDSLNSMYDGEAKKAREVNAYTVEEEHLRTERDRLRARLEDVDRHLGSGSGPTQK